MRPPQNILLLDDDRDFLALYGELLTHLPSKPEIQIAETGARGIALLEAEPFTLLVSDLKMAKMDGFQVLAIVRRKFPHVRTVVMTALADEEYRARAYGLGVDLFLQKPGTNEERKLFFDCIESLLGTESAGGFRGMQSKTLVDIIQLECLSQSSSVLKIVQGGREGKVWFQNGEIMDATTAELGGEEAFRNILSWKTGNFEILPPEPDRPRTIVNSYHALLLESAQAVDEAQTEATTVEGKTERGPVSPSPQLVELSRIGGVEFILAVPAKGQPESWAVENPERLAGWTRKTMAGFRKLGENLQLGQLRQIEGAGSQRQTFLVSRAQTDICIGLQRSLPPEQAQQALNHILAKWA